jgi:hypothetical protein
MLFVAAISGIIYTNSGEISSAVIVKYEGMPQII